MRSLVAFCWLCLAALAVACGGGGPSPPAETGLWVDAAAGNDLNPGTQDLPLRTISSAVLLAQMGDTIRVRPGTYDAANGETFPIHLPAGVTILGDPANRGKGGTPTEIVGDGPHRLGVGSVLEMDITARVEGFRIHNPGGMSVFSMGIVLDQIACTIASCTLEQMVDTAIWVMGSSNGHVIVDNDLVDNGGVALGFIGGGEGSLVEGNLIARNRTGIEFNVPGGDLGGGGAGSTGGNILSCNTRADLWTSTGAITIMAQNCFWDHVPPLVGADGGGIDIHHRGSSTVDATGAQLAPAGCP